MNMNAKMAKVVTLRIKLNKKREMRLVTTVDPSVTVEMILHVYGLRGTVLSSEESDIMPLPFAMNHSYNLQKQFGIIH